MTEGNAYGTKMRLFLNCPHALILISLLSLLGCNEEETKTNENCSDYSIEECADIEECTTINGAVWTSNEECYTLGEWEPQGCIGTDMSCSAVETPATDGDQIVLFASACIPNGWEPVVFEQYPECE